MPYFQQEEEPDFEVEGSGITDDPTTNTTDLLLDEENTFFEEDEDRNDTITVKTLLGSITGLTGSLPSGEPMCKFLGIPYAKPPVGEMRFQPPAATGFFGEMEALEFGSKCIQKGNLFSPVQIVGSEDCLFLNVYSKTSEDNSTLPAKHSAYDGKAVMVYIHGGGFTQGSGDEYDPTPLLEEDVIVVTINYRLGGLGFLTFGNDLISGNMGLRDQIEAIKWVKRNIIFFGGDPNKITIFGESGGAISVSALQISPQIAGLVSGVIMQSGNMLFRKDDPHKTKEHRVSLKLAANFNCTSPDFDFRTLKCLQQLDAEEFFSRTQSDIFKVDKEAEGYDRSSWWPVLDDYSSDPVIPMEPLKALKTGQFNKVPVISGIMIKTLIPSLMTIDTLYLFL